MWQHRLQPMVFNVGCFRCYAKQTSGKKTYYEILEVDPTASQDEIKSSYLNLSKFFHPDTATSKQNDTHNAFILLSEAYSVLSKPVLRKRYNEKLGFNLDNSKRTIQNPFRSSFFKDPYAQYDQKRRTSERWTNYYSTYGRKQARYNMEQNINSEFWQQHWQFTREHGGGGPRIATHEIKNIKQSFFKSETGRILSAIILICVICITMLYFSDRGKKDREKINEDYSAYLISKLSPKHHNHPKPAPIKVIGRD